ncbi:hypothetical protein A9Q99_19690 [Gammaproteobacteria bacterium 45_16_T64]|nr:hypothetical protein A9Q99_19690 [Gammaproteobacteria bacterium 45_16_T64]
MGMSLKELQRSFYNSVFRKNKKNDVELNESVEPAMDLESDQLVNIYRESILGGLTEALVQIYPVCAKLVGEVFFSNMVVGYMREYPSGSPDLADYGYDFSNYVATFEPAMELVYLADVATLEWGWHRAFNAEDVSSSEVSALASLTEVPENKQGDICFVLTPSGYLLRSAYPVHKIWNINQTDFAVEKEGDDCVNLNEGPVNLIVWRNSEFGMRIDVLSDDEYVFLEAISEGKSFAEIATLSCAPKLSELLGRCMQTGLLVGFNLTQRNV